MSEEVIIKTLVDFQAEVLKLKGDFIFRGQSNASWKVESGAYRRLKNKSDIVKYTEDILSKAKVYTQEIPKDLKDIELLGHLQHHHCATPLIDFSLNALVSLWFATEDSSEDGKVFLLDVSDNNKFLEVSDKEKDNPIKEILDLKRRKKTYQIGKWTPPLGNNRIIKQDSVFIFTTTGQIDDSEFKRLTIDKGSKNQIRKDLEKISGMTETSIYPDFYGFAMSNSATKEYKEITLDELIKKGNQYLQEGQYQEGIEYYQQGLEIARKAKSQQYEGLFSTILGLAYGRLGKDDKAIEYSNQALVINRKFQDRQGEGTDLSNLGSAYGCLDETEKAIEHYQQAIKVFAGINNLSSAKMVQGWLDELIKNNTIQGK